MLFLGQASRVQLKREKRDYISKGVKIMMGKPTETDTELVGAH